MDFSPWDWADIFRLHEAACLVAGVPVSAKRAPSSDELAPGARPVLVRLATAWAMGQKYKKDIETSDYPKVLALDVVQTELDKEVTVKDIPEILVRREELHRWTKAMGIKSAYSFAPFGNASGGELLTPPAAAQNTATPAPMVAVGELDYSLLATPSELLDAFGKWGMHAEWFDDLNSRKWLLDARRKKGQGTQGRVMQPLFCPFAVMNGLIGKVRKANRMQPGTAWRTLAHKFPRVYATFENHDPRDLTGD